MNEDARRDWHMSFLPSTVTAHGKRRLVSSYRTIFYGFAAWLTAEELEAVSRKPGFGRSFPDEIIYHPATTRTPEFLSLTKAEGGIWANSNYGKGVIIGVLDTGIYSHHRSFDDNGMPWPPAKWRGFCSGVRCNKKIIGARSLMEDDSSLNDATGHGTHVASIAAGNFVNDSYFNGGQAAGTAAGTSPAAHLAIYKVCNSSGCPQKTIIDGFEAAMNDGVDIISVSIARLESSAPRDYKDAVTVAAFRAVCKGFLVVSAAGNRGPGRSSVSNDAPWHFTVGAGSVDRRIVADIVLENGDVLEGEALVQGVNSSTFYPLHCPGENDRRCSSVTAENARGYIVVCDDAGSSVVKDLYTKGAAQVVLVSAKTRGYTFQLVDYGASTVQVPFATGQKLRNYCKVPGAAAQVSFDGTIVDIAGAPLTASFSGRGPSLTNPLILKPDILAPGLNILAAGTNIDEEFVFKSGTSMAAPHVSGVAALLKNLHADWSPAAIRSALMTTANAFDNANSPILNEQRQRASLYDIGGGHITPEAAADPGLIYEIKPTDYAAFVCYVLAGPNDDIKDLIGDLQFDCSTLPTGVQASKLNYPSLVVPANATVQRTLTSVGTPAEGETYHSYVHMRDASVEVKVSPQMLQFHNSGDTQTFQVTIEYQGKDAAVEGVLFWRSAHHLISSRIIVHV